MKTVSDFKNAIKTGVKINTIRHDVFDRRDENGHIHYKDGIEAQGEVVKVQSTQFAIERDGSVKWNTFPKKTECIFYEDNPGKITLTQPDRNNIQTPYLTYYIIQP